MSLNISVIIPVYNASQFLRKAVDSALQFEEVKEIVLVEDKSTDNSLIICQELIKENTKIKLYQHSDRENHGAGATRNLGLEKADSEYIAFLDADDYYLSNRFDGEKTIFNDPKIEGVFGALGTEFITEKGREEYQDKFKNTTLTTVNFPAAGEDVFKGLLGLTTQVFGSFFHLNTLTVKKSSIEKNNLRFNKDLRVHQDSDFIIKLAYHCYLKSGIIEQAIAVRGVHDDNRITKIKAYSGKFYHNNLLLQASLYQWSRSAKLNSLYSKKIKLDYLSFKIANQKGLKKWVNFFTTCFVNPEFIKTKYRFHALNNNHDS
ncbi:putative glycosyltransferase EpsJ [Chryseobacterium aquaeductus]|uniref:Glycosyltransferase EpsJ n=1 Tax=Chryseobacterium aquaeductus TaxID=2675056 RepID=A0A9N8QRZ0_9FLAO|nr:glycosyltransferase family 2 protein [Chryseobacterium aquaeductus]CAA7330494.1 putative glycosyltransferase EpsJ [Chryseobacterium potabilaquae]CAD7804030.1 putative glycosyltransferase EpsJ [Chryseobacterium aquaeductus]